LYPLADDSGRLLADTTEAASPAELVARWQTFLATAARGVYIARYCGETLGLATVDAHTALAA
jgi:hypothetical protein